MVKASPFSISAVCSYNFLPIYFKGDITNTVAFFSFSSVPSSFMMSSTNRRSPYANCFWSSNDFRRLILD
jgi:hypothetical protein